MKRRGETEARARLYRPAVRTLLLVRLEGEGGKEPARRENDPGSSFMSGARSARLGGPTDAFVDAALKGAFRAAVTAAIDASAAAAAYRPDPDKLSVWVDVIPTSSTRTANSYRMADELALTIQWQDLPVDPRSVRAIMVLHYEGTVSAADTMAVASLSGTRAQLPLVGSNLRFIGVADALDAAHSGEGSEIQITCRDLTAVLIDAKTPVGFSRSMRSGQSIVDACRDILRTNPAFDLIRGPFWAGPGEPPVFDAALYPRLAFRAADRAKAARSGAVPVPVRNVSAGASGGEEESYWDAITDLCVSHAVHPMVELDRLVIFPPRTLYATRPSAQREVNAAREFPTPGGHRAQIGDTRPIRRMLWGADISDFRIHRELARVKVPTIRVSGRDPDAPADKRLISETWPAPAQLGASTPEGPEDESAAPNAAVSASGKQKAEEVLNLTVARVKDRAQLREIARQVYDSIGRQEASIVLSTDDLSSWSDHPAFVPNEDPDLLGIAAGDAVEVLVASGREGQPFTVTELGQLHEAGEGALIGRGFSPAAARVLSSLGRGQLPPTELRVNTASFSFDADGATISVDLRNFARARLALEEA